MNKERKEKKELRKEIERTQGKKKLKEFNEMNRIEGVKKGTQIIESKKYKNKYIDKQLRKELENV